LCFSRIGCVSKILTRFYETGSIRPGSIGGSKTKVSGLQAGTGLRMGDGNKIWGDGKPHVVRCGAWNQQTII